MHVEKLANDPQRMHSHMCDPYEHVIHFTFNQMTAKQGIKKHREEAFAKVHDKKVFKAIKASDLSRDEKKNSLRAISLIKEREMEKEELVLMGKNRGIGAQKKKQSLTS